MEEQFTNIEYLDNFEEFSIKWKGGYQFVLKRGDLTEQETEVIVNAANNHLWLGGGVAGAIRRKGGDQIQQECNQIKQTIEEINEGDVFCSGIGNFNNKNLKYIFHAVGPVYRDGKRGEKEALTKAFINCFTKANELKVESLSLPPISSGIFGYPKEECAKVFYECLKDYLDSSLQSDKSENKMFNENTLKLVVMTIIDHETFGVFKKVHKEYKIRFSDIFSIEKNENIIPDDQIQINIEEYTSGEDGNFIPEGKIQVSKEEVRNEETQLKETQIPTQDTEVQLIVQENEIENKI